MTMSGVSSYSSSIDGSSGAAFIGFAQFAQASKAGNSSAEANEGVPARARPRFDAASQEAVKAKLESVNPDLAKKMEAFQQKMDGMQKSGASKEDLRDAMQKQFQSLTSREKSDLQSAVGSAGKGEDGDPLSSLKQSDPDLAKKLEGFKSQIEQMKKDGASEDDLRKTMKSNMDSLSESEKSSLHKGFSARGGRPMGPPPGQGSSMNSLAQSRASTLYSQAKSVLQQFQGQQFTGQQGNLAYSA